MARLDKRTSATLPGPAGGKAEVTHWDDELAGFGLRVLASGSRSWLVRYRVGRRQKFITLGSPANLSPADARKRAAEVVSKAKIGQDAQVEITTAKAQAAETFGKLAEAYLTRHVDKNLSPGSRRDVRRYLLTDAKPLHELPVVAVTKRRVADLLGRLAERAPVAADRCRANLSALFSWAMREGLAEVNPAATVNRPAEPKARERVLNAGELRAVWRATEGPGDFNAIVRLLMLTGQRREEVGAMRWAELDLGKALWSLPGDRTKNDRPHDIPLSDPALGLIGELPERHGRGLVFGEGAGGFSGWSKAKATLDERIAKARAREAEREKATDGDRLPEWRLHDLRRSVVTHMAELGVQPHVIEAVVNHVSGHKAGVAGVYNRATYAREKRETLALWAGWLMEVVEGRKAAVVVLRKAAGVA